MEILLVSIILILLVAIFLVWQNTDIIVNNINVKGDKIPSSFDGFVIVQVSDLHNTEFGKGNVNLLEKIRNQSPDIIVITGDLIDRRRYNLEVAMNFISEALKITNVYYVNGNHEGWSNKYDEIVTALQKTDVINLSDDSVLLEKDGRGIKLLGLSDPSFYSEEYSHTVNTDNMVKNINKHSGSEYYEILLSHRPDLINIYSKYEVDLVFCGHAHGGQIRIPFIGGIIAPNQGFFPKYTSGMHTVKNTKMIVNRGLGNSLFPFRIFNRPEIVVAKLIKEKHESSSQ